jgi:hypothetical protein
VQKLSACDFKQIQKDRSKLGLSMILGGCGTTLEELTGFVLRFLQIMAIIFHLPILIKIRRIKKLMW